MSRFAPFEVKSRYFLALCHLSIALARLYYLGRSADGARQGIGVAESDDPEWRKWTKL